MYTFLFTIDSFSLSSLGCPRSAMLIMGPNWCYTACIGNLLLSIKSVTPVEINVSPGHYEHGDVVVDGCPARRPFNDCYKHSDLLECYRWHGMYTPGHDEHGDGHEDVRPQHVQPDVQGQGVHEGEEPRFLPVRNLVIACKNLILRRVWNMYFF